MNKNIAIVIRREYLERVSKKSFIITTILGPIFMLLLMAAPALIATINTSDIQKVAVIDNSGIIMPKLENDENLSFVTANAPIDSLQKDESISSILVIGKDIVSDPSSVALYSREAVSRETTSGISMQLENIIEKERINAYGIDDLDKIMNEVQVDVSINEKRIGEDGTTETSSILSTIMGIALPFILYMFILMYGQMVMMSIVEEKNNRVLEIMVSSVKPTHLMLGKIIGVGLVAITQVMLWAALSVAISAFVLPALMPDTLASEVAMYSADQNAITAATASTDIDLIRVLSMFGSIGYIIKLFTYIILFLTGGFLFYAAINAAIGSAVDNIQDAGQLQMLTVVPIILGLVFSMSVVENPGSNLALWMSFIPFTSPMVMMARIPFDIPTWQIILSLVLLYASFLGMVWIAAKIYRVGIFMYGKKPSIKDLIRWARYK